MPSAWWAGGDRRARRWSRERLLSIGPEFAPAGPARAGPGARGADRGRTRFSRAVRARASRRGVHASAGEGVFGVRESGATAGGARRDVAHASLRRGGGAPQRRL